VRKVPKSHSGSLGLTPGLPPFLLGFLATSFQIFLLREFSVHFHGNELTFGLVLAAWLLWGGLGSLAGGRVRGAGPPLPSLYGGALFVFVLGLGLLRLSRFVLGTAPGELTGLVPALGFSLLLGLFLSFPLGLFFVLNARRLGGDASRVYILESFGAAAAGFLVHFALVPYLSNWQGAAVVAAATAPLIALLMAPKPKVVLLLAIWSAAAATAALDFPTQRLVWKPFRLVEAQDTPYGRLQVLERDGQVSLYGNGVRIFSHQDPAAAEESVHFALLQRPQAKAVYLVGGGVSGCCREILKYPRTRVDYLEVDPALVGLALRSLPPEEGSILRDPRVRIIHEDARLHLRNSKSRYDTMILSLPEPSTVQFNRFYTLEFFRLARERLRPDGVLSFSLPSAENYISPDLGEFLRSIVGTLQAVFPEVRAVPGENAILLASDGPLDIGTDFLENGIVDLGLDNRFIRPGMLGARLNPLRTRLLEEITRGGPFRENRDLTPSSYYFHSVVWARQFGEVEARALKSLAGLPSFWALYLPILAFATILAAAALKKKPSPARCLLPVSAMGFTTILVEMSVLIIFQSSHGSVYGKISLLLAAFMSGMCLGALAARIVRKPGAGGLLAVQGGFVLLLVLMTAAWPGQGRALWAVVFLLLTGALGGSLFVIASGAFSEEKRRPGLAYGLDLLGSFAGVLLASTLIIPLWGIVSLTRALVALNVLCFVFVASLGFRGRPSL
jgi:spermidine synthase